VTSPGGLGAVPVASWPSQSSHAAVFAPASKPAAAGATPTTAPQARVPDLVFDRGSHPFLGSSMFATLNTAIVNGAGQLPS
jgi:hypothetical protein